MAMLRSLPLDMGQSGSVRLFSNLWVESKQETQLQSADTQGGINGERRRDIVC
jgi:hypothetical protein